MGYKIRLYKYSIVLHNDVKKRCVIMFKIQKGYDSESKSFRLPIEMIEKLGEIAAKNKISLNKLVIQCLNYALENIDEANKPRS